VFSNDPVIQSLIVVGILVGFFLLVVLISFIESFVLKYREGVWPWKQRK
jgi:hypothetical protein